jgi:hypothetical protein
MTYFLLTLTLPAAPYPTANQEWYSEIVNEAIAYAAW